MLRLVPKGLVVSLPMKESFYDDILMTIVAVVKVGLVVQDAAYQAQQRL